MRRIPTLSRDSGVVIGATALLIVVTVGRAFDLLPFLYGVPLVKILTVLAFGALVLYPPFDRPSLRSSTIVRCVLALAVLSIASVPFSYWPGMSMATVLGSVAAFVALVVLVYKTSASMDTLESYLKALVWAGAALTVGGFLHAGTGRLAFGRSYDPNDLAYVLIGITPLTLALWRRASGSIAWLWAGIAAAGVWITLLTQSRGGLLGLLAAGSYLAAVGAWRARFDDRVHLGRVLVGWVLLGVVAAGVWAVLPGDARDRYATMLDPTSDYNYTAQREGRVAVWKRGLDTLSHVPWGVGIGAYPMAEMARSGYWRTAHNSLVELGVELGVVGLVIYLAMLVRVWRVLGRVLTFPRGGGDDGPDERWRLYAQHLRASVLGLFVAGFFLSQAYALVAFSVYAIVASLEARFAPRAQRARLGRSVRTRDDASRSGTVGTAAVRPRAGGAARHSRASPASADVTGRFANGRAP
jgi:hypothetical protein